MPITDREATRLNRSMPVAKSRPAWRLNKVVARKH